MLDSSYWEHCRILTWDTRACTNLVWFCFFPHRLLHFEDVRKAAHLLQWFKQATKLQKMPGGHIPGPQWSLTCLTAPCVPCTWAWAGREQDACTCSNLTELVWTWEAVFMGKNGWPRGRCSRFQLFRKGKNKSDSPSEEAMCMWNMCFPVPHCSLLWLEEALQTVNLLIYVNRVLPQFENNILAENSLLRVGV